MNQKKPVVLVILDGFGHAPADTYNAISQASTPHLTMLFEHYPHTLLHAAGTAVGLPQHYIGNSEVGHITIGSGRIIPQPLTFINHAIETDQLAHNQHLTEQLQKLKQQHKKLHIIGLLSDAGVHSHENHLFAYMHIAASYGIPVIVHAFLDGRDTAPRSATHYLDRLQKEINKYPTAQLGSIHGRFYAMDRDHHWNRTQKSYLALTQSCLCARDWHTVLNEYYAQNISDEFIPPNALAPNTHIAEGDGILSINFRPDRMRQLTACFTDAQFNQFPKAPITLSCFITPVPYNGHTSTTALFEDPIVHNTLKEVLSAHHKTLFSIAETEKYAHVTYFFSAGHETPFAGETWHLIPSLQATSYAAHPCMSAQQITDAVIDSLKTKAQDFYLINYANADMIGHSGDLAATIAAIECLDTQMKQLYHQVIESMNGTLYITADHGNAENMFDAKTNQPHTAHTRNQVPFLYVQKNLYDVPMTLPLTQLADIAPFILHNMHIKVPDSMKHKA